MWFAGFPEVIQVIPSHMHKLHTTRSWDFIGLEPYRTKNLLNEGKMGEGIIIGIIDSGTCLAVGLLTRPSEVVDIILSEIRAGVWPELKSFSDEGMSPVPSRWKGICQQGEWFKPSNCNRKLIGARWFIKAFLAGGSGILTGNRTMDLEYISARDAMGHGTHTASTAAGNFVDNANYDGLAEGLARGGAPRAHLAVYKACWNGRISSCFDADILKAFDKAIHDGVDVLSISLGDSLPLFPYVERRDSIAIGSFHAVARGITVVASAGNDGPSRDTVANVAPWLITVGASTIDRRFVAVITLGNNRILWVK